MSPLVQISKTAASPAQTVGLAAALGALFGKLGRDVPALAKLEAKQPMVFDALLAAAVTAAAVEHKSDAKKDHKLPATPDNPTMSAGYLIAPGFHV